MDNVKFFHGKVFREKVNSSVNSIGQKNETCLRESGVMKGVMLIKLKKKIKQQKGFGDMLR